MSPVVDNDTVPLTAIVTAYQRIEQTLETLRRIEACHPRPDEILVHVDGGQVACADAVRAACPHLVVITSPSSVGPGGGRNKLVALARNELIASFDDDSYPIDADFFGRAVTLADAFPDVAVYAGSVFNKGEALAPAEKRVSQTASFGAGGVVLRRSEFLKVGGFVPLVIAYGMEEEDLALRLIDRGLTLKRCPWLRIFHDNDLSQHNSARITSATIANIALLAWLRYPVNYWPYGVLQIANRIVWCLRVGRRAGVISGVVAIPGHLARHRRFRHPVSNEAMRLRFTARAHKWEPFARGSGNAPAGAGQPTR